MNKSKTLSLALAATCAALLITHLPASAQTLSNRWSFNAPVDSTTVTDSVSSVVATLNGNATLDGTEVNLDGSVGTYVSLGGNLLAGMQAASFEGWANSSASPDNVCLFEFSDGSGYGVAYARYVIHDGNPANTDNQFELAGFGSTTADPDQQVKSGTGFGGVPLHVVCTYDPVSGVQAIYTNGVLEVFRTFPANQTTLNSVSTNEASLGQSPWWGDGDNYMAGTISEFRIWNGPLNALQVAALDAAGPGAISTNSGAVTGVQLQVAYQMTEHAFQQAMVIATATGLSIQPNIALQCTYSSGNTNILTVSQTGSIGAVAAGSATITAIFGTISNTQTISVSPPVAALSNRWSFFIPPADSTTVTDSVQGVVATLQGNASLDGTNVNLDGTSETYVSLGSGLLSGIQAVTCEAWVATNSTSPDNVHLYEFSDGNGTGNAYYRYNLHNTGNANNFSELANVNTGGNEKLTSLPGLGGFGMLHVVTIYDPVARVQAIFTNGALEAVQSGVTTALSGVSTNEASLGRSPWFSDPCLNGSISEFRIYSGEMSPQQVALDYLAGPTTLNTNGPGSLESIALQVSPTMQLAVSQTPGLLANYANLMNFNILANSIFPVAGLTITSSATNIISVNANNVLTSLNPGTATITAVYQGFTSSVSVTVIHPPLAQLLHRYSFGETSGTTAHDSIGGANGTLFGDAQFDGSGHVTLDGTYGTYVSLPGNLLAGLSAVTVEAWLTNAVSPDNVCLFSFDDGVGQGQYGNGTGYLRFVLHDTSNTRNFFELGTQGSGSPMLPGHPGLGGNNTVHVVCVYDTVNNVQAIYTNGVLEAIQGASVPLSTVGTNAAAIGRSPWWNWGDPWLAGSIDEFRIYSGRLLATDVALTDQLGPNYPLTPTLSVTLGNGNIILSWPTNYVSPSFTAYSSSALGAGASWSAVGTPPSTVGANFQISLPAGGSAKFFRLQR
jgi:hypothetical protein